MGFKSLKLAQYGALKNMGTETQNVPTQAAPKSSAGPWNPIADVTKKIGDFNKNILATYGQQPTTPAAPAAPAVTPTANFGSGKGNLRGEWATQYGRAEAATQRAMASQANQGMRDAAQRTANAGFSLASDVGQRAADSSQAIAGSNQLAAQQALGDQRSQLLERQKQASQEMVSGALSEKQKQYLQAVAAQGGDVEAAAAATLNPDGTLKTEFQDPSAAQVKLKAMAEEIRLANPDLSPEEAQAQAIRRLKAEQMTMDQAAKEQETQVQFQTELDKSIESGDFTFIADNITSMDEAQKSKAVKAMKAYATKNDLQAKNWNTTAGLPVLHNGKVYILTRKGSTDGMFQDSRRLYGIDPQTGQEVEILKEETSGMSGWF